MEIFVKSSLQLFLERGVPALIVSIIAIGYFLDGHGKVGVLALMVGVIIAIAVLSARMPTSLTLRDDAMAVGYNRGADLVIPYEEMRPSIGIIQQLRLYYTNTDGKKAYVILGAYWRKDGASISNIGVIQAIEKASKRDFKY